MEDKQNYISKKRTVKDAWAFILYLIYTIGVTTFLVMFNKDNDYSFANINYKLLGVLTSSTLIFIISSFFMFAYLCEFILKISVLLYIVAQLVLIYIFPNVVTIVLSVFSILFWCLFVYLYWSIIPDVSKVLSYTTKICLSHFKSCFFVICVCSTIQIFQIVLAFLVIPKLDNSRSIMVLTSVFLNLFWTLGIFNYFFKVYISGVVAYHFINSGSSVFGHSIRIALYALGSISYAALVISAVQTLRLLVNIERNNNRKNLFVSILLCILSVLFSILEDIIEFANGLAMFYITIHGTGYSESCRESFKLASNMNSVVFGGLALINIALSFISLLMIGTTFTLSYFTLDQFDRSAFKNRFFMNSFISTITGVTVVYFVTMVTFTSSYLALIFLYAEQPKLISDTDPEIADILKKPIMVVEQKEECSDNKN